MLKVKVFLESTKKYSLSDTVNISFYYPQGNKSSAQNAELIQLEPDGFIVEVKQTFLQVAEDSIFAVIETGEYPVEEIAVELKFLNADTELEFSAPANQISIPQIESDIPNRNDFTIGSGYDIITSNACPTAVNKIVFAPSKQFETIEHTVTVSSESDYKSFINAALKASATVQNVDISGSIEFTKDIKVSSTSMSVISSFEYRTDGYDEVDESTISLSDKAKEYLEKNGAAEFRKRYGDYFINAFKRGSRFNVVYTFSSSKASDLLEFKASVGAKMEKVMEANISIEIKQAAEKKNINSEVHVYMTGCKGVFNNSGEWNGGKIAEALSWFKSNLEPVPLYAQLKHYCIIESCLNNSIDVSLDAYNKQAALFYEFWLVRAKYNALNNHYKEMYGERVESIKRKIMSAQYEMYQNPSLMADDQAEITNIHNELRNLEKLQHTYFVILEEQKREPGQGCGNNDYVGFGEQVFGVKEIMIDGKNIVESKSKQIRLEGGVFKGYQGDSFEFSNLEKTIVGFSLISHWNDGTNGYWKKETPKILLQNKGKIYIGTAYKRGCNWTITYYYTDLKNMKFN